jgi:D-alanyl-D-alanine endopeptidase (penicillin-binding protein 7)
MKINLAKTIGILLLALSTAAFSAPNKNESKKRVGVSQVKKETRKKYVKPIVKKSKQKTKRIFRTNKSVTYSTKNIKYSVFNYHNGKVLEENNSSVIWPIASLTKLMTAYVFVNNVPNIKECNTTITLADTDTIKGTRTKLATNKPYNCEKLLQVMLIASDNYAASALARSVPGWTKTDFIRSMNEQARKWGLDSTRFVDSSGLSPQNKSSVDDYRILTTNVVKDSIISDMSSQESIIAENKWNREITYRNSNKLVREQGLGVNLSKTGYIRESGYNLVHLANCATPIGVVEFGARSSEQRANFVKQKLAKYGCS